MRKPLSTYRLQFEERFGFADATAIVDYLDELGISDVYASPLLAPCPGSTHGYDVADPTRLNPALGTERDFETLTNALGERSMGILLDIVPNHMGAEGTANPWWREVLISGRSSPYARYFDIYWDDDRIGLPVLGDGLDGVLERGELWLDLSEGAYVLRYYDHEFPLSRQSTELVIRRLPTPRNPEEPLTERTRNETRRLLKDLSERAFLEELLRLQAYRLEHHAMAGRRPGYRRFFDINHLVAVRVEDPLVFEHRHRALADLLESGRISGLRVDHIDGLRNPRQYTERLQQLRPRPNDAGGDDLYVVVEKILGRTESLPAWPVAGTTGYDFLNVVCRFFIDPGGADRIRSFYREFTGISTAFPDVEYAAKKQMVETSFAGDVERLARHAQRMAPDARFSLAELRDAVTELTVCLPVYRTYREPETHGARPEDVAQLELAFDRAVARNPRLRRDLLDWLWGILIGPLAEDTEGDGGTRDQDRVDWVLRFQQLTGPAAAKGVEDTAFYRYVPLTALNEVGGEPNWIGVDPDAFHEFNIQRQRSFGASLSATTTHDTKRGEDARTRLGCLSEISDDWQRAVRRWHELLGDLRTELPDGTVPDANEEYLFYQACVGALDCRPDGPEWDAYVERIDHFMLKALRESKVHTQWIAPSADYEAAVSRFVLDALRHRAFSSDLAGFVEAIRIPAALNSLSQVVLKVTSPGIPDFYQGSELWDLSLVDPDNRRPVDFARRRSLLKELRSQQEGAFEGLWEGLGSNPDDARMKLLVTHRALATRRRNPDLFWTGDYVPLRTEGPGAEHLIAFARVLGEHATITVATRFLAKLGPTWEEIAASRAWQNVTIVSDIGILPQGSYRDTLTGATFRIRERDGAIRLSAPHLLLRLPAALLERHH